MIRNRSLSAAAVLLLMLTMTATARAQCPDPEPLPFAETVCGTIDLGEIDCYSFEAMAGDVLWIQMNESPDGIPLDPRLRLYDPNGVLVPGGTNGNNYARYLDVQITATGTYTLEVFDGGMDESGGYCLFMQRINNPVSAAPLPYAEPLCDSLTSLAQSRAYTFDATAGDVLWIRMNESPDGIALEPRLRLYDPNSVYVPGETNGYRYAQYRDLPITMTGAYTLLAFDEDQQTLGDFCLHMQRINNPVNATPLPYAEPLCGSLTSFAQNRAYTFDATAGDVLWIRMNESPDGIALEPRLRLYDPNGAYVSGETNGYRYAQYRDLPITMTGAYTLLAFDEDLQHLGDFCLYMQRINDPVNATPLPYAEPLCDSLATPAQNRAYTFDATDGDVLWIQMNESPDGISLQPRLRLYDPNGVYVPGEATGYSYARYLDVQITLTGTYTLLAFDGGQQDLGDFCLFMQRVSNPVNAMPLGFGEPLCDSITGFAENRAYTFNAIGGDAIRARMEESPNGIAIEPRLRLYDPLGTLIATGSDGNTLAQIIGADLAVTGAYTLLAFDNGLQELGDYRVEVELCQSTPCPPFCLADFNEDGAVDVVDLLELLSLWGVCECCEADFVDFGVVDVQDLLELLAAWGPGA